jgi:phosphoribosylamine--glycine ligase
MNILVLGSGGREHAMIWKISQSPLSERVYCIPGNGGISDIAECHNLPLSNFQRIADFVREMGIDFTVVGPEQPLVDGIVDFFKSEKLPVFGPNKSAARIEGSKIFSKELMQKYQIPTAEFQSFEDMSSANRYLTFLPDGYVVVKADGLAAGKGSVVCQNINEAKFALDEMMSRRIFKDAGARVVIEEFMTGVEASLFVITDGKDYVTLAPAQDYKRALDHDEGKNTGGMGCYAPTPFLDEALYKKAIQLIVEPTLSALQSEGINYKGVLYVGLILTANGPKVVEYNCRFGDPETQVVLPLLRTDLVELLQATHHEKLGQIKIENTTEFAVCVVLASGGYPDAYKTGSKITGLNEVDRDIMVFHAGTRKENGDYFTNGGRVLGVAGKGSTFKESAGKAYRAVEQIRFEGMHYRRDISKGM